MTKESTGSSSWKESVIFFGVHLNEKTALFLPDMLQSQTDRLAASGNAAVNPQPVLPDATFGKFWSSSP